MIGEDGGTVEQLGENGRELVGAQKMSSCAKKIALDGSIGHLRMLYRL